MSGFEYSADDLQIREDTEASDEAYVLEVSGRLDARTLSQAWRPLVKWARQLSERPLHVQARQVDYCDGAGITLFLELKRIHGDKAEVEIEDLRENFQKLLDQFDSNTLKIEERRGGPPPSIAEDVGKATLNFTDDLKELVSFLGELFLSFMYAIRRPKSVRWREVLVVAENAGVNGLPIVALIGFLMGLIMSFQAAIPLRQFGADIFVADLIALSMLRELGPLMTAIILAGRTGSAFAAELGTMQINEEIDALKTMGLPPVRFLVVTRVTGATFVTPLLTLFANLAGLIGGAVVLLSLGFPLITYYRQAFGAVDLVDLTGGLAKSVVFGFLVSAIGCLRGLQTKSGATSVGHSTTRAVVSAIILIALADGVFAVVYYYLGI